MAVIRSLSPCLVAASLLTITTQLQAETPTGAPAALEEMSILGTRIQRESKGATGLALSLVDTPQSISLIEQDFIQDFALDDLNEVLKLVTGVNVEEIETDRTYYNARGFDIKSMQVDGKGLPFTWNVVGSLDSAIYEKVEVVRGANGLLTGTGNPSGTINYVRKRPTNEAQGQASMSVGSWSQSRLQLDYSAPITDSGSWAGRSVLVMDEGDTWLDHNSRERNVVYGIVDGQLSQANTLALGLSWQQNKSKGVLWGALPLLYSDNSQAEYDVSTSTTMDWTRWNTQDLNIFVELTSQLGAWEWVNTLTRTEQQDNSELFYIYSVGLDSETGLGLFGWPGKYYSTTDQNMFDSILSREFSWLGREHQVVFGLNISESQQGYLDYAAPGDHPAWGALPAFPGWRGNEISRPDFGEGVEASDFSVDVKRFYAVSEIQALDNLSIIAGANAVDASSKGISFGDPMDWSESDVSPYIGLTYSVLPNVNLYSSFSEIFEPQVELTETLDNLGPARGESFEAGLKGEFLDQKLFASVAVYTADQENYAEYAGFDSENGISYYAGTDVKSEGFELEVSGKLGDRWLVVAGFTQTELEGSDGQPVRTYVPEQSLKTGLRFTPNDSWRMGVNLRWQSDIYTGEEPARIEQSAYSVLSAFANWQVKDDVSINLNVNNIGDQKYLSSLYWDQSFYGAPRNAEISLRVTF